MCFLGFKVVKKRTMNLFKGSKDFRFGWIEKYKPALSKSDSSWDNSFCMRLVIVFLAVNIDKLQSLVSEDNYFVKCITISAAISCHAMI